MGRILLVAEADPSRDRLARRIAEGPHTVRAVAPGQLSIVEAREWDPDIIVMDLATDGLTVSLRISMLRDPVLAHVPFVALGENEEEARALGAHAFVKVPPHLESLMQVLAHFARLRAGRELPV